MPADPGPRRLLGRARHSTFELCQRAGARPSQWRANRLVAQTTTGREQTMPEDALGIRVMLVDDHEVVRRGLMQLLAATEDLRVVAEAGSVRDAVAEAQRTRPDVVVMDVRLIDGSGLEATREIRSLLPRT